MRVILNVIGGFLLFIGILFLFAGIGMWMDGEPQYSDTAPAVVLMSMPFVGFGGWVVWRARKMKREQTQIVTAAGIIRTFRRIKVSDLAQKMNLSERETEALVAQIVSRKIEEVYMDRVTGEVFTDEGESQKIRMQFCPSCGAALEASFMAGETVKCSRCGMVLQ